VPARARNLSPIKLCLGEFLDTGSENHAMASANPNVPIMNAVLHMATGKEIQYNEIIKHPTLVPQYKKG
jgi:hypothetical protein